MKKLIAALLIAAMIPAFAACSVSVDANSDIQTSASSAESDSEEATAENPEDSTEIATEVSTEESTEVNTGDITTDTLSTDGIDPELVRKLEGFESYADDYVAFMKKYGNVDMSNMSAEEIFELELDGFAEENQALMDKSDIVLQDMQSIDFDSLSPKEQEYFRQVRDRAQKKVEEAGFSE